MKTIKAKVHMLPTDALVYNKDPKWLEMTRPFFLDTSDT